MYGKRWYKSKTVVGNVVAALTILIAKECGYTLSPEIQAGIIAAFNFVLRIITKEPLTT